MRDRDRRRFLVVRYDTGDLLLVFLRRNGNAGTIETNQVNPSLDSPDGLEIRGDDTLVVVENVEGGQLSRIDLEGDFGKKESMSC